MKLIGIEEHFLTADVRDAWTAIGLPRWMPPSLCMSLAGTMSNHPPSTAVVIERGWDRFYSGSCAI